MIYNYDFDIAGLVFLTIGIMSLSFRSRLSGRIEKRLLILVCAGYLYNIFDIVTSLMLVHAESYSINFLNFIFILYFLQVLYFPYAFISYICEVSNYKPRHILKIPLIINVFMLIFFNTEFHLFFGFTEQKKFYDGSYRWLLYLNWAIYIVYAVVQELQSRKEYDVVRNTSISVLVSISIITAVLQIMFPYVLLMGVAVSLVIVIFIFLFHFLDYKRDELTGLLAKEKFCEETKRYLKKHKEQNCVLIRLDIHHFYEINAKFGHQIGNQILKKIAENIRQEIGANGVCGYLGSDDFICCTLEEEVERCPYMFNIGKILNRSDIQYEVYCYLGIYKIESDNISTTLMCDRVEYALNRIKHRYLYHKSYFSETMELERVNEIALENEMFNAIKKKQFCVYFQPVYDLKTGEIVSAEALVRWKHPDKGMVSPEKFIPLFEQNGFITDMDCEVLEQVGRCISNWKKENKKTVPIAVNISRQDFNNKGYFPELLGLIQKYNLETTDIMFEITESAFSENLEELSKCIDSLRKEGFKILMDDFGSGYSSFNMFQNLPVDILKIDFKFLSDGIKNEKTRIIMESIIHMTKRLDMPVVVEGVESMEQIEYLKELQCEKVQGYYLARPMLEDHFIKKLSGFDNIYREENSRFSLKQA